MIENKHYYEGEGVYHKFKECPRSKDLAAKGEEPMPYPPPNGKIPVYEEKTPEGETKRIEIGDYETVKGTEPLSLCPECKILYKKVTDEQVKIDGIG